ncbi:MAG: glutamate--tRNA ligase [Alphaproteobacteria bacterium]|nr:glutamate--tRNA ligase [Alphaproteobacteria bacterium]NDC55665.1 glutamate--tRNA ligase [Alphaproteobacteria bacterium]NDG03871.1 glutamate--tRNA ligase [Alphaproteobacteria bacterium]
MSVVVRFPPSPTGYLHIGSARTALFNWLYAKRMGGKFLLRIEDTDQARSTPEAVAAIFEGLKWLELKWDNDPVPFQMQSQPRHAAVADDLLRQGKAYYCYCSPEELEAMREEQRARGDMIRYDGRWRDRDPKEAPAGIKPVIRLKAPQTGATTIHDQVMGTITVQNSQLDDMVLLRSDGTPTYMLSVVVDDYDMGITHVIRGDDHLTNTFRQVQILQAMGWPVPVYAHLPLILGPDGQKLSKRHGAPAVSDYRDRGYLPEAMRNYLLRLCWSHGDDEIIPTTQAIQWFDLGHIGQSPARFDFAKLDSINAHYIKHMDDAALMEAVRPFVQKHLARPLSAAENEKLLAAMPLFKPRIKTLVELAAATAFLCQPPVLDDDAKALLTAEALGHVAALSEQLMTALVWDSASLEGMFKHYAAEKNIKMPQFMPALRALVCGTPHAPSLAALLTILGRDESVKRLGAHAL